MSCFTRAYKLTTVDNTTRPTHRTWSGDRTGALEASWLNSQGALLRTLPSWSYRILFSTSSSFFKSQFHVHWVGCFLVIIFSCVRIFVLKMMKMLLFKIQTLGPKMHSVINKTSSIYYEPGTVWNVLGSVREKRKHRR